MGTKITELMKTSELSVEDLRGKIVVVDAFNQLYMFLSSIRQPDGSLLKDSHNNVTSHLNGLFYRFTKLMQYDIRFVFVFDGKAPDLKLKERERRSALKHEA
jgi:flap endonuclease-1